MIKLRSDLEPFLNKEDPYWQIFGLVFNNANLQGAIQDGCLSHSKIIDRAAELDLDFLSLAKHMVST